MLFADRPGRARRRRRKLSSSHGVVRGEASGQAVAPYSHPVVRLGCLITLVAALAAGLATGAWADADPASDMLYVGDVFLPYEPVSPAVAGELRGTVRSARAEGKPIKVAVIATKRDLGGVPTLFGNPLYYARFLGAELQFLYSGKLLVVMPQGAALSERGKLIANPAVLHARIEQGTDGLVRTATGLVRDVTGTEGSSQTVASTGGGSSAWIWIVIGVAVAAALGALAFVIVRIRRQEPA